jgi:hypothetical protein
MTKRPSIIGGLNLPGTEARAAIADRPPEAQAPAKPTARKARPDIVHTVEALKVGRKAGE